MRLSEDGSNTHEYALVDESRLQADSTSDQFKSEQGGRANPDSLQNEVGAYPDMHGANPNMARANPDMPIGKTGQGGANPDNDTLLVDISLKDSCLKEGSLKERNFKVASVPGPFPSPAGTDANGSSGTTPDKAGNSFAESVASPIPVEAGTKNERPAEVVESAPKPSAPISPVSPVSPVSPPSPVRLEKTKTEAHPGAHFLDPLVHQQNKSLSDYLADCKDEMYQAVAQTAVEVIRGLFRSSKPQDVDYFTHLPNQKIQDEQLMQWATPYFADYYEKNLSQPQYPENESCRAEFIRYCQRLLSMGFFSFMFHHAYLYAGQGFCYQVELEIGRTIRPWREQQEKLKQQQFLAQRKQQNQSPDQHLENEVNLSAAEKMRVFQQNLIARNKIGIYDDRGQFVQQVVNYNQTSMNLVREFFQLNPQLSVSHLNLLLDRCLELPPEFYEDDEDPQWHARNGRDITRFIRSVDLIATQLNLLDQLPAINPLPPRSNEPAAA